MKVLRIFAEKFRTYNVTHYPTDCCGRFNLLFGTPDFVVMNGSKTTNPNWEEQGLNSENFVMFNLTERIQIIGGALVS